MGFTISVFSSESVFLKGHLEVGSQWELIYLWWEKEKRFWENENEPKISLTFFCLEFCILYLFIFQHILIVIVWQLFKVFSNAWSSCHTDGIYPHTVIQSRPEPSCIGFRMNGTIRNWRCQLSSSLTPCSKAEGTVVCICDGMCSLLVGENEKSL